MNLTNANLILLYHVFSYLSWNVLVYKIPTFYYPMVFSPLWIFLFRILGPQSLIDRALSILIALSLNYIIFLQIQNYKLNFVYFQVQINPNKRQIIWSKSMYGSSGSDFYTSGNPQAQVFQKLKQNIQRLKSEREQLRRASSVDRSDLNNVQIAINHLNQQLQSKINLVREKQKKLMDIERAINQTQKSYDIIVETTTKLSNALQNEANHLRNFTKK